MARRRYPFGGYNRVAAMPTAIPVLKPALKVAGLQAAYEWMPVNELASLQLAMEWWADAITPTDHSPSPLLYLAPLDAAQQKTFDMSVKVKGVGDSTNYPGEKIGFYSKAIKMYEGIWSAKHPGLPTLDAARANATLTPYVKNIQTVFSNFNKAFAGFGVTYRMTFGTHREFLHGEVLVPKAEASELVGQPPLKAVLAEIPTVAQIAATTINADGEHFDGSKFIATLPQILSAAYAWAAGDDKAVMRPIGKVVVPAAPKGPRAPKAPGAAAPAKPMGARIRIPATDPFGIFKADTIKAAIAQLLYDRQWHPLQALKTLCQTYGVSDGMIGAATKGLTQKAHVQVEQRNKQIRIV